MDGLEQHDVPDAVATDGWALTLRGAVATPREWDRDALTSFPPEQYTGDFECEAGWVAKGLSWRGVRVGALLDEADPEPGSEHALVHAMDGEYACSFPLDRLADAMLALELDGEPLPVEHGGPARLVPTGDADCWESVKWVDAIEVTVEPRPDTAKEIALGRIE